MYFSSNTNINEPKVTEQMADGEVDDDAAYADAPAESEGFAASALATEPDIDRKFVAVGHREGSQLFDGRPAYSGHSGTVKTVQLPVYK